MCHKVGGSGGCGGSKGVERQRSIEMPTSPERNRGTDPFKDDVNEIRRTPKKEKPQPRVNLLDRAKEIGGEIADRVRSIIDDARNGGKVGRVTPPVVPR